MSLIEKAAKLRQEQEGAFAPSSTAQGYTSAGKRPHRRLYSGGIFSDAMDALSTTSRASAAAVGAVTRPQGGGYLARYRNPETSYGDLLKEAAPVLNKTWYGRALAGTVGGAGDVFLDPATYVPYAGAIQKLLNKGGKGALAAAKLLGWVDNPVREAAALARKVPVVDRAAAKGAQYLTGGLEKAEAKLANTARNSKGLKHVAATAGAYVIPTAAKKKAKAAIRTIRNQERLSTTVNARNVGETAGKVDTIAAAEAKRLTGKRAAGWLKGSPVGATREGQAKAAEFRQGVGRILDKGYDAMKAAEKKAAKEAEEAAKKGTPAPAAPDRVPGVPTRDDVAEYMDTRFAADYAAQRAAQAATPDGVIEQGVRDLVAQGFDETAVRDALRIAQEQGNRQGAALASRGIIEPETAARNRNVYARRIYDRNERPDVYLENLQHDPIAYLKEEARQAGKPSGTGGPISQASHQRKDLDETVRAGLGEIPDVTPRLLQGGDIAGRAVARKDALDAIAAHRVDEATATANPTGYRLLEGAQWGPADGAYLPREVYDEVQRNWGGTVGTGTAAEAQRAYNAGLGAWKFGKVILSPAAMARNVGSNAWRAFTELGVRPDQFFRDMAGGARDVITDAPAWRGAFETAPVFGSGNFLRSEFRHALDSGSGVPRTGLAHAVGSVKDVLGLGLNKMAGLYSGIEDAGKMGLYNRFYKQALEGGASEAEARAFGADAARRALFDYGEAPPMAEWAAKTGLIPFARYSSLAVPAEAKALLRRPERYAKISNALREWSGMAPDQEQQGYEEQTMPTGYRENLLVRNPFHGPGDRSLYTDLTTVVPFGNVVGGRGLADSTISTVNPMEANPVFSYLTALSTGVNPQTQTPISEAPSGTSTRVKDWLKYGWQQAMPPLAPGGFHMGQIKRGLRGDMDPRTGIPIDPRLMALRAFLGVTQRPLDAGANVQALGREMAGWERDWNDTLSRMGRSGTTPGELEATMAAATADMEQKNAEYLKRIGPLEEPE